jgi:two-component system LytT family response regulator
MITALIVDDEEKAVVVLRKLLEEYCPEVKVIAQASRVNKATQLIEELRPQLIFLDIEMPGKSGFDLLENLRERNFHVILVTAHSEFALKAFRFSVTDYLLKPVAPEELLLAVKKVKNFIDAPLASKVSGSQPAVTLRIPSTEGVIFVYLEHVIRVEAEGAYSHIHLDNGKHYLISENLKELEEHLDPSVFIRVHRSHVINLKKIKSVIDKHGLFAEMEDGTLVEVARRTRADFLKLIH